LLTHLQGDFKWWPWLLLFVHCAQGVLLAQMFQARRTPSHQAQDRLLVGAAMIAAASGWAEVALLGAEGRHARVPGVLVAVVPALVGTAAGLRILARSVWLARVRKGIGDGRWIVRAADEATASLGLVPLVEGADGVLVAKQDDALAYRRNETQLPVALVDVAPRPASPRTLFPASVALATLLVGFCGFLAVHLPAPPHWEGCGKCAEASNELGQIAKRAVETYEPLRGFCPSASRAVPADIKWIRGHKYQSDANEWTVDAPKLAGFACLGISMEQPQYYQYLYEAAADGRSFRAIAHGDLNGDGVLSTYAIRGWVENDGSVAVGPNLESHNPEE